MEKEVRWKQRFTNFQKAYRLLRNFSVSQKPSEMEQMARIQAFEMCFELSWKVLKDYFYEGGIILNSPREILKEAIKSNIIENQHLWMDALDDRNKTSHAYDESMAEEISKDIHSEYLDLFSQFSEFFSSKT